MVLEIKKEWKKTRKDHGKIQGLMGKTYVRRRELVLVETLPLGEIIKEFPPLQNMLYVST